MPTQLTTEKKSNGTSRVHKWDLNYQLSSSELAEVRRVHLSDFGLPEPQVPSRLPSWTWGIVAGVGLILIGLLIRKRSN